MFPELNEEIWQPNVGIEALKVRSEILHKIRHFFYTRGVLEVETPLMCARGALDPHLQAIPVQYRAYGSSVIQTLYLQTSPEYAMKRLLAGGSGSIYQLCKAFREGEIGKLHNPEFTMLEWYRLGFNHHDLMSEVEALLSLVLETKPAKRITYQELFQNSLNIDPHSVSIQQLETVANDLGIHVSLDERVSLTSDDWLDLIITHHLEPKLGNDCPWMIYDYPVSQAALARVRDGDPAVAERFEVYFQGIELANGFHELTDGDAQFERFQKDFAARHTLKRPIMDIDMRLVNALKAGLPPCAGVALGVDRLLMLKMGVKELKDVISFTIDRA